MAFNHPDFLVSFKGKYLLNLSLSFLTLTFSKSSGQAFCRMSIHFGLSETKIVESAPGKKAHPGSEK